MRVWPKKPQIGSAQEIAASVATFPESLRIGLRKRAHRELWLLEDEAPRSQQPDFLLRGERSES